MVLIGSKRTVMKLEEDGFFRIAQGNSVIDLSPDQADAMSKWLASLGKEARARYSVEEPDFPEK